MNLFAFSRMNKNLRLNSLQYLRVFAAISVILFHVESGINSKYWVLDNNLQFFSWGDEGVSIFFCLSGFVIPYSSYNRPKKLINFLYSRIIRIYPAYIVTSLLFVLALIFLPDKNPKLFLILKTIFFNFGKAGDGNYVYVGWTLFYEMIFYTMFSLIINNFRSIAKNDLFIYLISSSLICSYLMSLDYITYFLVGINIFIIKILSSKEYKSTPFFSLILSYVVGIFFNSISFYIGIILITIIKFEEYSSNLFKSKFILFLADSSYSIYLAQVLTVSASLKISRLITLNTFNNYYFMYCISLFISIIATIILGITLRKYIEKPFYDFFKKLT